MTSSSDPIPLGTAAPLESARVQPSGLNGTIDELVERARREAYEAGVLQAKSEIAGTLAKAVARLEEHTTEAEESIGRTAIQLGLEIAQHLLKTELDAERHDIERIVRDTLHEARVGRDECVVHVSPADFARLEGIPFRSGTKIQADAGVSVGDVQVESALGCIVREVDRALESIGERLRGELSR